MNRRSGRGPGVAMVAALLTLAAVGALAAALFLLLRLDIALAANRQQQATARALAQSNLTAALLGLERAAQDGTLPEVAPAADGLEEYSRTAEHGAVLSVAGQVGESVTLLEARVELVEANGVWRLIMVDAR